MTRKTHNKSSEVEKDKSLIEHFIQDFLATVQPAENGWNSILTELDSLILQHVDERNQALKVRILEDSLSQLLGRFSGKVSRQVEIDILLWAGHRYENFGNWRSAVKAYRQVVKLSDEDISQFHSQKSEALRWTGYILAMQNKWDDALKHFHDSLDICVANMEEKGQAQAYNSLGILHFEQGNLDKSAENWNKALEIIDNLDNGAKLSAKINNNLGILSNVQGNPQQALAFYSESVPRFEKIGDVRGLAEVYHNMAMTYCDIQRWSEAEMYYNKSYYLAREAGDVRLQATVRLNRVKVYINIKDWRLAEALSKQSLKTFLKLGDRLGEAEAYKFLGLISTNNADWELAKKNFQRGIRLTRKFNNPLTEAELHMAYGRMFALRNKKQSAKRQLQQALELFTQLNAKTEIEKVNMEISTLSPN